MGSSKRTIVWQPHNAYGVVGIIDPVERPRDSRPQPTRAHSAPADDTPVRSTHTRMAANWSQVDEHELALQEKLAQRSLHTTLFRPFALRHSCRGPHALQHAGRGMHRRCG